MERSKGKGVVDNERHTFRVVDESSQAMQRLFCIHAYDMEKCRFTHHTHEKRKKKKVFVGIGGAEEAAAVAGAKERGGCGAGAEALELDCCQWK